MVHLNKERIDLLMTPGGGFTFAVLHELGAEFIGGSPLPWRKRIEGTWVSDEKWAALVAASKQMAPRKRDHDPRQQTLF
ncbi:MAG TPA: hypothetical protein VG269_20490 [Tepidisphaeraceae bacterium]|jgi:hypothetical protein|nr:hypothetical protein [Tepidisphaeraceae bacterium]